MGLSYKNSTNIGSYCSTHVPQEGLGYAVHSFIQSSQDCQESTLQMRNRKVTLKGHLGPVAEPEFEPTLMHSKSKLF